MGTQKKRTFSAEYKRNVVEMVIKGGKKIQEVSRDIGISGTLLSKWKTEYLKSSEASFPGKGNQNKEEGELRKLRNELTRAREERDILKKAVAFFSRDA